MGLAINNNMYWRNLTKKQHVARMFVVILLIQSKLILKIHALDKKIFLNTQTQKMGRHEKILQGRKE